ncbi:hypothetical protein ACQVQT_25085 [Bacillus paranthracis]|uniref:hypothetical protein n=1 Tax=Bacillus cereus group TaxID=86661 RepID=UPI000772AB68|nr:hypothetical protein [Bacillus paranthracis]KXI44030.1 hypothetical protein ACS53_03700 [Bacillus cereus]MCC2478984.1 hypothetical protein [Bacillus paranthracis]MCU5020136.1 hypothetical protein [Bacillus paranthracis]HDR7755473.1 hypothetical protein [Bacillus paranthracis]
MSLNEEDNFLEEDEDEGIELKTIPISEYVKLRREQRKQEQRKQEQQAFEDKLKVLKEKTARLKRELGYKE